MSRAPWEGTGLGAMVWEPDDDGAIGYPPFKRRSYISERAFSLSWEGTCCPEDLCQPLDLPL